MCGIAGLVSFTDHRADPALVGRMPERLVHRGPDDEGLVALGPAVLGVRRLSILDPTPAGHQPMTSRDGRYTIAYNGEIYNFWSLPTSSPRLDTRSRRRPTQKSFSRPTRSGARPASNA